MKKALGLSLLLLMGCCEPPQSPNNPMTIKSHLIKENTITLRQTTGKYPILHGDYQAVNDEIKNLVDGLVAFDKDFHGDDVRGVTDLDYQIHHATDKELSFAITYGVQDTTGRLFKKLYYVDLVHQRQVSLSEYLTKHNLDIKKFNQSFNEFLKSCHHNQKNPHCDDIVISQLMAVYLEHDNLVDILKTHDGFYVIDDNIVIAFYSNKSTSELIFNKHTGKLVFDRI